MIRGIFISEDGAAQVIGENIDYRGIIQTLPQLLQQLKQLHKDRLIRELQSIEDTSTTTEQNHSGN